MDELLDDALGPAPRGAGGVACPPLSILMLSAATNPAAAVVGQLPLLGFLPEELRSLVVASFVPLRFGFGETIVREGDPPDGFYVLSSGLARVREARGRRPGGFAERPARRGLLR